MFGSGSAVYWSAFGALIVMLPGLFGFVLGVLRLCRKKHRE